MRGVTALFGASGSGKTTLLRLIAGLERASVGRVALGERVWQDDNHFVPTHQRPIGFVFQDARLFPHLTVAQNLAYGQRRAGAADDIAAMAERLGLTHLLARKPARLSGGEAQRVAIARALLTAPRLLLMDEPLSALDPARRAEILPYLERLHAEAEIPIVYVSHSFAEVARLADHLVLLEAGRVTAQGALTELTTRLDLPLASGTEAEAIIEAQVAAHDRDFHLTRLAFAGGELWLPYHDAQVGQPVRVGIRARDVSLTLEAQQGTSILNILPVRIAAVADCGPAQVMLRLSVGEGETTPGTALLARVTRKSAHALNLVPGRRVFAQVKSVAIVE